MKPGAASIAHAAATLTVVVAMVGGAVTAHGQICRSDVPQSDSIWTTTVPGEIVDSSTLLTWKRCLAGQSWDGTGCTGSPSAMTWQSALQGAPSGWRLPNIKELESLVARECVQPALNTVGFAGQPIHVAWSSTPLWSVDFGDGTPLAQASASASLSVRYVKSDVANAVSEYTPGAGNSATCNASIPQDRPTNSLIANAEGTVSDSYTGLVWTRCAVGQTYTGGRCTGSPTGFGWQGALQYADTQRTLGWRLPNLKELESLTDRHCFGPAINGEFFPDHPESPLWTSTPTWTVNFNDGVAAIVDASSTHAIRLVKDGGPKAAFTRLPDRFPICSPNISTEFSQRHWLTLANGTARNIDTQLIWARCYVGQTWTGTTCAGDATLMKWQSALQTADTAAFAGAADWRLPNIKELESTADRRCLDPVTHPDVFPNSHSTTLWSSTPNWYMDATDGMVTSTVDPAAMRAVRLVRGGGIGGTFNLSTIDVSPVVLDVATLMNDGLTYAPGILNENRVKPAVSGEKVIIVTHGWNSSAAAWPDGLVTAICARLQLNASVTLPLEDIENATGFSRLCVTSDNWRVVAFSWAPEATFNLELSIDDKTAPWVAFSTVARLARDVAPLLFVGNAMPSFVHVIGHSAGSNFVHELTGEIKKRNVNIPVQQTYLDAFCPDPTSICQYGGYATGPSDYIEHYVDSRLLLPTELRSTNRQLKYAHNFEVGSLDSSGDTSMTHVHAWPYWCYLRSADAGNAPSCLDRSAVTDIGFRMSPAWHRATSVSQISAILSQNSTRYPRGAATLKRVAPGIDGYLSATFSDQVLPPPGPIANTPGAVGLVGGAPVTAPSVLNSFSQIGGVPTVGTTLPSSTCIAPVTSPMSTPMFAGATLAALQCPPQVGPNGLAQKTTQSGADPAVAGWTSVRFATSEMANLIDFEYSLEGIGDVVGSVFVDDVPILVVSKATAPSGWNVANRVPIPELSVGEHRLGVRADGTGEGKMMIRNVAFRQQRRVSCVLDLDGSGHLEALTDGVLLLRGMLGLAGASLTSGIGTITTSEQADAVSLRVVDLKNSGLLDFDQDSATLAESDGLMALRAMLGFKGDSVTAGLLSVGSQRSAQEVRVYMKEACGFVVD